jgi:hypothetical protein
MQWVQFYKIALLLLSLSKHNSKHNKIIASNQYKWPLVQLLLEDKSGTTLIWVL